MAKTDSLGIRVQPEIKAALERAARDDDRSVSSLVERILRSGLPADMELKENSVVEFTAPNGGTFAGFLRELDATHALFDFNHPMAGKTIRFEVEIIGIM